MLVDCEGKMGGFGLGGCLDDLSTGVIGNIDHLVG